MWLLSTIASSILTLGTTHGFFRELNPEVNMNVSQIISYWGYQSEEHEAVTEDSYILDIYRIPYEKKNAENKSQRPVVFLQCGLLTSATNWIANLPNNSLGFLLADAGYDVWLGNSRGNTWARRNIYYSPDSVEFWAFSFDNMTKYDLPSTIDFILNKTGQGKLHYVGHSQGTTIGFISFSTNFKLAKKIKAFYAFAPAATGKHMKSLAGLLTCFPPTVLKIILGVKAFLPSTNFSHFVATEVCSHEILKYLCSIGLSLVAGFGNNNLNMNILSGKLQAYDWGNPVQNMVHYGQFTPPYYNVMEMNVPIAAWGGGSDSLVDPQDVDLLLPKLSNLIYHKAISSYNHMDFIWAMNAPQEIYNEVVFKMEKDKN